MSIVEYGDARKLAMRDYRSHVSRGEYPFLPVLDDILNSITVAGESNLGLVDIPMDFIVGTRTAGRTNAFSSNFLPLLSEDSEFASKWSALSTAHLEEGIRDPIKVCEFLNRFYVVEGNKRVSVLKFFGAESIHAYVTRILPQRNDTRENKLYYEFVEFYRDTGINYIEFTKLGSFRLLLDEMGKQPGTLWTDEEKQDFSSAYHYFAKCFRSKVNRKLSITPGDGFLTCIKVYGYEKMKEATEEQINTMLSKLKEELVTTATENPVALSMQPVQEKKPGLTKIINNILPVAQPKLKVAFIYDKRPDVSTWIYGHEMGRMHLEEVLKDKVETTAFTYINTEELADKALGNIINQGYSTIFVTSPQLIDSCVRAAVDHPEVRILNCSLNTSYHSIRTYYSRIYEAKFLTGVAAGAMCEDGRIGYLADYPLYGTIASINAFALGARMVNPRAKIYLDWTCLKDKDPLELFRRENINYISGMDNIKPKAASREFGLYLLNEDTRENLMLPVWNWGVFYERLVRDILDGTWKAEEPEETSVSRKAINYWWGMSAGVIDVICSSKVPAATKRMVDIFKNGIITGFFAPLGGIITDQNGIQHDGGDGFSPEELIKMDWLADNIIGSIPEEWSLKDESVALVKVSGVKTPKLE
ncbi:MAG: BMP family ABC transporter substrate-binding protein [Lachnospiraceae bacterium]|nr:BMP family ABC transporter substrate-binding protein [Lachnospiraceae bacterium]